MNEIRQERQVEVLTTQFMVRGFVRTPPSRRTLDELNLGGRLFLTLHRAEAEGTPWPQAGETLAANKSKILFLRELGMPPVQTSVQFGRFTRAPLRLCVGGYTVHGFIHVPPGGEAFRRLDQDPHLFLPLTSVLVTGAGTEFSSPFLAVNRSHVTAAQAPDQSAADTVANPTGA